MSFAASQNTNSNSALLNEINQQQPLDAASKNGQHQTVSDNLGRKVIRYMMSVEIGAAIIGAAGTLIAAYGVFLITQIYQGNDSRQKALNDYINNMKELIASTGVERDNPQTLADLQKSQTFLVMRELAEDGDRKGQIVRFLHETCLFKTSVGSERCIQRLPARKQRKAMKNITSVSLSGIDLDNIDLQDTWAPNMDLRGVFMREANLQKSALSGSDLTDATLIKSNFQDSNLAWVKFNNANLTDADFNGAQLYQASFVDSNLSEANFAGADLRFTNLTNTNLVDAKNLTGACYVEGTEDRYFPAGFEPGEHNMMAISADESNPSDLNSFKHCPAISASSL